MYIHFRWNLNKIKLHLFAFKDKIKPSDVHHKTESEFLTISVT